MNVTIEFHIVLWEKAVLFSLGSVLFNTLKNNSCAVFVEFVVPSVVEVISPLVLSVVEVIFLLVLSVVEVIFLPTFDAVAVIFHSALYETARKIVVILVVVALSS